MYATIPAREGLNFPAATAADWQQARRRLVGWLVTHGVDRDRAGEIAQEVLVDLLTRQWKDRSPATPRVAVAWRIATAKRYGIGSMTKEGHRHARRRRRTGQQEAQPAAEPLMVRDVSGRPGPDAIAAAIESAAGPVIPSPVATRRRARIEAWVRDAVTGWGEGDEPNTVPSVTDLGPGYTPPARGCRGLHRDTDPRPAAAVQAEPLTGENLTAYRQQVAAYYAR